MTRRLPSQPLRIAIDTGGTFTDCVWLEQGRLHLLKVFSTPADPSLALAQAVRKIAGERDFILLHGTTVGTNALLERSLTRFSPWFHRNCVLAWRSGQIARRKFCKPQMPAR